MDRIVFMDRRKAQAYKPAPQSALISVIDHSEAPLVAQPGWGDILRLSFHDMREFTLGLVPFDAARAYQVLSFADKHQGVRELVVHCNMGNSRSAAIALFLAWKYTVPCYRDEIAYTPASWPFLNRLVFAALTEANASSDLDL